MAKKVFFLSRTFYRKQVKKKNYVLIESMPVNPFGKMQIFRLSKNDILYWKKRSLLSRT